MARALELAWRGWGRVAPNPLVGAVIVRGAETIAEGYHAEFGAPHAEVVALGHAGEGSRGATLVVSLEPCIHVGKQPPCTPAILEAGIRRVVIALADPNPAAAGGIEMLLQGGLEVETGMLGCQAARQNAMFRHRFAVPDRPFIALKLATSLDGRLADRRGRSRWLSGPQARDYVHWLRAGFDAIGVGGATARCDNPSLTVRGAIVPRVPPVRVVFSESADLADGTALRAGGGPATYVVGAGGAAATTLRALKDDGVRIVAARDLQTGLGALRAAGIASILVEGGGRLAARLFALDLVDRFYWIQAPLWLGADGVPAFPAMASPRLEAAHRWSPVDRQALGNDTLLILDREPCSPD